MSVNSSAPVQRSINVISIKDGPLMCLRCARKLRLRGDRLICVDCDVESIAGKVCGRCQELKPFSEFYSNSSRDDGLANTCKPCSRQYQRERSTRDDVKAVKTAWRQSDAGREMVRRRVRDPEYKAKKAAHRKVERAVANGTLIRPDHCEHCDAGGDLHAHHEDYSQPLLVLWLCRECHGAAHHA